MAVRLRIAGVHLRALRAHLFPGDGKEAVAFALCGRHRRPDADVLIVHEVHPIPYGDCPIRTPDRVTWRTDALEQLLGRAASMGWGVVKFHSQWRFYEIEWLRTLAVPFVLGRVDPEQARLDLYSLGPVWRVLWQTATPFEIRCLTEPCSSQAHDRSEATHDLVSTKFGDSRSWSVRLGHRF
jgi:hypothetical protein